MQRDITLLKKAWTGIQSITAKITGTNTDAVYVETSDADATAADMLNGKTAYVNASKVTGNIATKSSGDLSASGATVTAPAGYYASSASKSVSSGTEGTPTASKGAVNNHSVRVTPSVTNSAGYISGGTKTGTAVSVSASELVSGSETKTANGTYDVTNLAELVVNVSGTAIKTATGTFTGNGTRTIDVTCAFEPDIVYVTSNPGTTASSGTVALIIVRGMMTATRYRNNSTSNSHYAIPGITDMNTGGSSYSWRATYANGKVTLYCFSNNARALLTNGRTYSYTFVKYTS